MSLSKEEDDESSEDEIEPVVSPVELNLSSNEIEELSVAEKEAYSQLFQNAQRLHLHENKLKAIPADFIAIGQNLRELTLDKNVFKLLDFSFLNSVPELKSLSMKSIRSDGNSNPVRISTDELKEHALEHLGTEEIKFKRENNFK